MKAHHTERKYCERWSCFYINFLGYILDNKGYVNYNLQSKTRKTQGNSLANAEDQLPTPPKIDL